jgi:sarcosine/dimethylglycine N-methyltransferase
VLAEFYAALEYGGLLILDQRNYDGILDHGFTSKHIYYYCGDNISAEPVYIDEGLARFQYRFPDQSEFHLNMFPLRKEYMRRLMLEVGFQHIYTYADFQETHKVEDPDFFIHVAEKVSKATSRLRMHQNYSQYSQAVETARAYYNSSDADRFYAAVWGGEDIHIGIYKHETESIYSASRRTVAQMAAQLPELDAKTRVLDIGSGYGGAARHLANTFGCHVTCLNLSESQNRRNHDLTRAQGLHLLIHVVDGSFEDIALPDGLIDVVWSQDAILHSGNRERVFAEVRRVLDKGGNFILTDIMQSETCAPDVMQPILDRIDLESLGSLALYRAYAAHTGLEEVQWIDLSPQLSTHYTRVLQEVQANYEDLRRVCSEDYLNRAQIGLQHWIDGGKSGDLVWGILHFRKS